MPIGTISALPIGMDVDGLMDCSRPERSANIHDWLRGWWWAQLRHPLAKPCLLMTGRAGRMEPTQADHSTFNVKVGRGQAVGLYERFGAGAGEIATADPPTVATWEIGQPRAPSWATSDFHRALPLARCLPGCSPPVMFPAFGPSGGLAMCTDR